MLSPNDYLTLSENCFLKSLEEPCVYNVETDDLFETNREAFNFLQLCDGSRRVSELKHETDFLKYCLKEQLLATRRESLKRQFLITESPNPSLRYLEMQVTARCNLRCRHCYLGAAKENDIPYDDIMALLHQFEMIQGLRLIISGGEPLLHPEFWSLNEHLREFGFRSILISNGTLIDSRVAKRLKVHEVQVSLDGIGASHDVLRGRGSYAKAVKAIQILRSLGKEVSVATMIHARNLADFPEMKRLVASMGIKEWNVDLPSRAGNLVENSDLMVEPVKAARLLKYSFGGGLYSSSPGYACGAHLCTVTPDGHVVKCGFFSDQPVGHIKEGLRTCWGRIKHIKLEELECQCQFKEECRGGCRFRAAVENHIYSPDPVQCYLRKVRPQSDH